MSSFMSTRSAEQQYLTLLYNTVQEGTLQSNRTGVNTYFLPGAMLQFDLRSGFPLLTTKKMSFGKIVGELLGFIRGYDNAEDFRNLGCDIWDANANSNQIWLANPSRKGEDDLGRIYGVQWSSWFDSRTIGKQPTPKLRKGVAATYLEVGNGYGKENHPLKGTWMGMMDRCYSPKSVSYPLYGGRGVYVCDRWLEFLAFAEDASKLPGWSLKEANLEGHNVELDKDIHGGRYYGPDICEWVRFDVNLAVSKEDRIFVVEKDGIEYSFTNITKFCEQHGATSSNFSDLWTGNKNAKIRNGFKLVRVDHITKPFPFPKKGEFGAINQLQEAIRKIYEDPTNRRNIVSAWNPSELDQMALPPCHLLYQFICNVSRNELNMCMYQRSCDMFLGVPFNIASYALLLSLVAQVTGYKAATLTMFLADVHVYENHVDQVWEQLSREAFQPPKLEIHLPSESSERSAMEQLELLSPYDIKVHDYKCHAPIQAPMAV